MKRSTDWKLTPAQRYQDKRRAERALGRPILEPHCVHHHSSTQLVICQDTDYHALLHQLHYDWRIENDPPFVEYLIRGIEANTARVEQECDALRRLMMRLGATSEEIDEFVKTPLDQFQVKAHELSAKMRERQS